MRRKRFCIFLLLMVLIMVVSGCNKKQADDQTINNEITDVEITDVEITDGKEMSEDSYDDYRESNHKNHHEDEHH